MATTNGDRSSEGFMGSQFFYYDPHYSCFEVVADDIEKKNSNRDDICNS